MTKAVWFYLLFAFCRAAVSDRSLFTIHQCSSSQQAGPAPWISLAGLLLRRGIWSFPVKRGRENKTLVVNLDTTFVIWLTKTCVLCSALLIPELTFLGRNWHEVHPVGVAELQLVCLHARAREQEGLQVMVPVPAHILISHERWGPAQCLSRVTTDRKWGTDTFYRLVGASSGGEGGGNTGVSEENNLSACQQWFWVLQTQLGTLRKPQLCISLCLSLSGIGSWRSSRNWCLWINTSCCLELHMC